MKFPPPDIPPGVGLSCRHRNRCEIGAGKFCLRNASGI